MPIDVLLVDDDPFIQQIAAYLLRSQRWQILQASDGRAALGLLETHQPKIVVTDVDMPGLDGFELTRRVTDNFPGTLVVVLTGDAERQGPQCVRLGAECVLTKAKLATNLVPTVSRLLTQRCDPKPRAVTDANAPLHRDAMRFAMSGRAVQLLLHDGRILDGTVIDLSFAGVAIRLTDVSPLRIQQLLQLRYEEAVRPAVIRNIQSDDGGGGRVGLEWKLEKTP